MLSARLRRDRAEARRAVPAAPAPAAGCSSRRTKDSVDAQRARQGRRHRARPRGALHRSRARHAVRLHRDRARSRRSRRCCAAYERARRREGQPRSRRSCADEYVRNFLERRAAARASRTSTRCTSASCPTITLDEVNSAREGVVPRRQPHRHRHRAARSPGSRCPTRRSSPRVITAAASKDADGRTSTPSTRAALLDAPPDAGHGRQDGDEGRARHHRVGALERRQGRAEADDVQGGRDPVPRVQPRRHVARERRRLHPGQHRGRRWSPPAASASSARSTCARC